jgi:ADP-ribose pyrophosphatase YjhB (NUDIX family)
LEPEDASVWDCARREIYEETGLQATLERMIYVREFREPARNRHHFEVFFYVSATQGEAQLEVSSGEEADGKSLQLQELKWLSQEDLQPLKVYPLQLKKEFWEDWREGFPTIRYLEGN